MIEFLKSKTRKIDFQDVLSMNLILTIFGSMNSDRNFIMRHLLLVVCLLIPYGYLSAQELPPVQNYSIEDYKAGHQNWSVVQTANKHMYFGNNNGLLEFNGLGWKLFPSPNGSIIRAVHVANDIVYTGCYMEFGYWVPNQYGELEYRSLLDKLTEPLVDEEHFWNITARDEWVLFQSLNRIYLYNTEEERFEIIEFNTSRAKIFNLGSNIFIQKNTGGLYSIRNGKAVLFSDHKILRENFIVGIYNLSNKILIITERGKFYFLDDGMITEWKIEELKGIQKLNLYSSLQLRDGGLILGTISNGFIHIDKTGKMVESVNQETGLINNTVLSAYQDVDDNLWMGLDNGISVVNLESPFNVFTDSKGKLGVVYASLIYKGYLYLGTNQGLFYRQEGSSDDFKMLANTNGQVWNLEVIQNILFCSHTRGTFIVDKEFASQIFYESGTWKVWSVPGNENLLIQGNYNGLSILEKSGDRWRFRNKIEGFDISSKTLVFFDNNKVLINHEFKGLFKLEINKEFKNILSNELLALRGFDSSISRYQDRVLYNSNQGVFEFDPLAMQFSIDSLLTEIFYSQEDKIEGRLIVEKGTQKIWGFSENNIILSIPDNFDARPRALKIAIPDFFRRNLGVTGYENLSRIGDDLYLIGTSNGYITLKVDKADTRDYQVAINSIFFESRNFDKELISLDSDQQFEFDRGDLNISFNVPLYDKYTEVNFQYRLKGLYDNWSKWFKEPGISLGKLPNGSYTFVVRAKVGNKISENEASYSFVIKKPWYLTNLAFVVYVIGLFLFIGLIHRSYLRYYRRQKHKLIQDNKRSVEITQLANEQSIILMRNQQLETELSSKNSELATTAMSLIKKNELLLEIKKELSQLGDESSKVDVIKVIDKNLKNNNDWDFFKEAFNNADKDFLNKIKILHSDLTANDLKFCAFLRLNLSSKEIAPLLNISVRSVEIKRYRLRKKMKLDHSDHLIDYILEI